VKCTPDETGRCTTCGDMLSVPKKATGADRIAALEAELAEARMYKDDVERFEEEVKAERAAHERTKANYAKALDRLADAEGQLKIEREQHERTKSELAEARRDLHEERSRANDYGKAIERERAAHERTKSDNKHLREIVNGAQTVAVNEAIAERDAAQAEAAAMRSAIIGVIEYQGIDHDDDGCPEDDTCRCENIARVNAALKGTAGRALAARVPLWREVERRFKSLRPFDEIVAKLAALDNKGGGV
jgi:hypothetical protein